MINKLLYKLALAIDWALGLASFIFSLTFFIVRDHCSCPSHWTAWLNSFYTFTHSHWLNISSGELSRIARNNRNYHGHNFTTISFVYCCFHFAAIHWCTVDCYLRKLLRVQCNQRNYHTVHIRTPITTCTLQLANSAYNFTFIQTVFLS